MYVGSSMEKRIFFQILSLVHDWVLLRHRASDEALTHEDWTILTGDWPGPRSSLLSTEPLGDLPWMWAAWDSDVSSPIVTMGAAWDSDVSSPIVAMGDPDFDMLEDARAHGMLF